MAAANEHHALFERKLWYPHEPNRRLRNSPGLIIPIDADIHSEIHREVGGVVPPPYALGAAILKNYRDNPDDHLRSLDNLMTAVDRAMHHPRCGEIEQRIGELIILSVEAQIPLIREGMLPNSYPQAA